MNIRKLAVLGVSGAAGLGLIGVGSHAAFTQNTASDQQVTAGTMKVVLSQGAATDSSGPTLTLPAAGPESSSFSTGDTLLTITNKGNVAINAIENTINDNATLSGANKYLHNEVFVCEASDGNVIYNGPLSAAPINIPVAGGIAPGATDTYSVNIYAGTDQLTACGANVTGQNTPSAPAANPNAASLNNDAQGGVIDPSVTLTYTA